ncbi:MAG: hypothetical protein COA49_01505 [Bacteroidetes bacterium]|nr:MAG: hypothetical protein COA49_01505 [Bacteroidota bacterium]
MTSFRYILICCSFLCLTFSPLLAQTDFSISGNVRGVDGELLPGASLTVIENNRIGTSSNDFGHYDLDLPSSGPWTLRCSMIGYIMQVIEIDFEGKNFLRLNITLQNTVVIGAAEVVEAGGHDVSLKRIDARIASRIPTPRGTIEDVLLQAPVNFTSELSSAYNVRGGSFDENLVYVNDIEVYRPFLVRSGQQEGLSFPNPDMVQRIRFSAGGFESKYGDKLSSVLDIHYRKPKKRRTQLTASLLGGQLQHDGLSPGGKFRINTGLRYRNNSYILGTLDETGEYNPTYLDAQTYITWDPDGYGPWEIQLLGVYGQNDYHFVPQTRETDIGTINNAIRLKIFFDGEEKTSYQTGFGALAFERITENTRLRWINSAFRTVESESFDILGAYWLDELELDPGSDDFGESANNLGVGGFLNHARNQLQATVISSALKGSIDIDQGVHFIEYGVKGSTEIILDNLSEWSFVDSAGYISPHPQDSVGFIDPGLQPFRPLLIENVIRTSNDVRSNRFTGYIQDTWSLETNKGLVRTHLGARFHYWKLSTSATHPDSFSIHLVGGPRGHISYTPIENPQTTWSIAGGFYWQPPFYREMRAIDGTLNPDILPQRAIHAVAGVDHQFEMYERDFKFVGELYYKDLDQMIPYEVENVRQRYYATNNSSGYATGIDLMLNGEFIDGIESWMRVSALKTEEDISDDFYLELYNDEGIKIIPGYTWNDVAVDTVRIEPGFIARPSDQRLSVSLLFQDEMPSNPDYKVLLSLFFGTGLPYGPPTMNRYQDVLRTPAYRRVDLGFSKELLTSDRFGNKNGYISLEVFNILGINNTISHTWIEDVNGRLYAIPNFLTSRRLNLKLHLEF